MQGSGIKLDEILIISSVQTVVLWKFIPEIFQSFIQIMKRAEVVAVVLQLRV